jgi:hypothetical protein
MNADFFFSFFFLSPHRKTGLPFFNHLRLSERLTNFVVNTLFVSFFLYLSDCTRDKNFRTTDRFPAKSAILKIESSSRGM